MERIRNNVMFKLFLAFVVGILLFSMVPTSVYATTTEEGDLYIDGKKILSIYYGDRNSSSSSTWAYWDPSPFTFVGEMNGDTKYYDGDHMALEVSATSTAGMIQIHIDLLVYNTYTHHDCTIWATGNNNKFDWISLGNTGGSSADCYYYVDSQYATAVNTVDVKSYSWI